MTETMQSFGLTWYRDSEGKIPSKYIKNYLLALELGYDPGSTTPSTGSGTDTDSLLANDSNYELSQFYYHKDQLGSSTHITDVYGVVYQHVEYMPFGSIFTEERNTGQDLNPYLFNGKELDAMTNLSYFGARYYDPFASVFLGVDPMMDKHGDFSPFAYCYNNPINLIDPFGLDTVPAGDVTLTSDLRNNTISFGNTNTTRQQGNGNYNHAEGGGPGVMSSIATGTGVLSTVSKQASSAAVATAKMQSETFINTLKKFDYDANNLSYKTYDPKLLKYANYTSKVGKVAGYTSFGAGVLSTSAAGVEIYTGNAKPVTYSDFTVGLAGVLTSSACYFGGIEIPVVGEFVAFYGAFRVGWDAGWYLGENHGISTWFEPKQESKLHDYVENMNKH